MNDLRELLTSEADRVHPKGDLDDVFRRADRQQRHTKAPNVALSGAAGLVFVAGTLTVRSSNDSSVRTTPQSAVTEASLGGIVISDAKTPASYEAHTLDRRDPRTADGPYSIVVRAKDGSMIQRTYVVTYLPNAVVRVLVRPETIGTSEVTELLVARDSGTLRVRAVGLTPEETRAIGNATQVVDGRPEVSLASLPGVIAYIGYSAMPLVSEPSTVDAMARLA
jgi:hypothetical protein